MELEDCFFPIIKSGLELTVRDPPKKADNDFILKTAEYVFCPQVPHLTVPEMPIILILCIKTMYYIQIPTPIGK